MNAKNTLQQNLRQNQFLVQQQIRLARMLELSAPELDEVVEKEVEENPALELHDEEKEGADEQPEEKFRETAEEIQKADYSDPEDAAIMRRRRAGSPSSDEMYERPTPDNNSSLYDILLRQLHVMSLPEDVRDTAEYIIGNLDTNGYLRRTPDGIADDILIAHNVRVSPETVARAIEVVHSLEPYGIGASDLQECLLIQLRHLPPSETRDDALLIVEKAFDALTHKHSHRIISTLRLDAERVDRALALIVSLNPKPGAALGSGPGSEAPMIIPDFLIDVNDGKITVTLNNSFPELTISESYERAVKEMERNAAQRKSRSGEFVFLQYNEARDFINLLRQRQKALFSVMTAIVSFQKEYFLTQDIKKLRPLGIKHISEVTGYDASAVSRSTANKYAATPWGVFPLRFFFSDTLGTDASGEVFTAKGVEEQLRKFIDEEDKKHPLSDENLRQMLEEAGYDISRRTVAKYRDRMEIPVARLRKKL